MNKNLEGLMLWQKVGLFLLFAFPILYIATTTFSGDRGRVSVVEGPKEVLKIEIEKKYYNIGDKILVKLSNFSDKKFYFRKPCEGLVGLELKEESGKWQAAEKVGSKECGVEFATIDPDEKISFSFYPEMYQLALNQNIYRLYFEYSARSIKNPTRHDLLNVKKVYSKEFTVNNTLDQDFGIEKKCSSEGCKVVFSHCDCNFHCVAADTEIEDCNRNCDEEKKIQREMMDCKCDDGECKFVEPDFASESDLEIEKISRVLNDYFEAEKVCNKSLAEELITKRSRKMVRFTCSNMKKEVLCNGGVKMEFVVKDGEAVAYPVDFSYKKDNPYFFLKEEGAWKLDLYKMANNLTMLGSDCDGWAWRTSSSKGMFCSFFEDGKCPVIN